MPAKNTHNVEHICFPGSFLRIFLNAGSDTTSSRHVVPVQWLLPKIVVLDVMRLICAIKLMQIEKGLRPKLVPYILFTYVSLCSSLALGLWMLADGRHECPWLWTVLMTIVAFLNGALCFLSTVVLAAGSDLPQVRASNVSVKPDHGQRVVHLTLRTFTVEPQSTETDEMRECVICLSGPYCPGEVVTELHCHHTFHSSCIAAWMLRGGRGCPMRCEPDPMMVNEVDVESAAVLIPAHEIDVGAAA